MVIVGLDEVGRGCWAGPLVAGAVVLNKPIAGLKDSKKLSKKQRKSLDAEIKVNASGFGIGWVSSIEVDDLGLTEAVRLAMIRAIELISVKYDEIIIDGNYNYLEKYKNSRFIIKADDTVPEVSAASIIAKVARDNFMCESALKYPGYGFEKHVGYGTKLHFDSIKKLGICDIHRLSFKPIAKLNNVN